MLEINNRSTRPLIKAALFVGVITIGACAIEPPDVIRIGVATAPVTLDPRFATDAVSVRLIRLFYRSLVDFDEEFRPVPDLATWEAQSSTHFRLTLGRDGRRFHNGMQLNAEDVAQTYRQILEPSLGSPHRTALTNIIRIEVIDEDSVDFVLERPDPLFPGRLVIGILPATLLASGHDFGRVAAGSGPFQLIDWPVGGPLRMQRTSDAQQIELIALANATVRALKLVRGEVDIVAGDLPAELVQWLRRRADIEVISASGTTFSYLGFNLTAPAVEQLVIRRAIAHAINRKDIIHYVLGDSARPAQGLFPPEHWLGSDDLPDYAFDPVRARELLSSAGFTAQHRLKLTYKTSSNPFRIRLATIIQQQLAEVGIDLVVQSYDWGTLYGDIKAGRFEMYSLSWVGLKMPDAFRYIFHSESLPPHGANRGRFKDAQIDRLIDVADSAERPDERVRSYQQLQTALQHKLPYVPLWFEDSVAAHRSEIQGYRLGNDGNYDALKTAYREK